MGNFVEVNSTLHEMIGKRKVEAMILAGPKHGKWTIPRPLEFLFGALSGVRIQEARKIGCLLVRSGVLLSRCDMVHPGSDDKIEAVRSKLDLCVSGGCDRKSKSVQKLSE